MLCLGLICSGRWGTATMACPKQRPAPRTRTGKKVPAKSLRLPKNKTFLESVPGLPRHMAWFLPSFTQAHTKKRGRKRQIGCSPASPAACWAEPCFCTGRRRAAASTRSWPRLIRPAKDHHVQQELPEALQSPISAPAASPSLPPSSERGRISVPGPPRAPRTPGTGTSGPQVVVTPIPPQMLTLHGWVIHGAELEEIRDLPREKGWKT